MFLVFQENKILDYLLICRRYIPIRRVMRFPEQPRCVCVMPLATARVCLSMNASNRPKICLEHSDRLLDNTRQNMMR